MAIYETIFILDSLLPPEEIDKIVDRVKSIIEENKGKVLKIDHWGKKRMAYEIQKKQYGYYVAIEFESTGDTPHALESDYNYNDKILRYLTYFYDESKLKAREKEKLAKQSAIEETKAAESEKIKKDESTASKPGTEEDKNE